MWFSHCLFTTNRQTTILTLQVRAESPMEHIAQGKRSDTLGLRVLEQSRPERAKALQRALDLDRKQYIIILTDRTDSTNSSFGFSKGGLKAQWST